jgi:hypothetical protein
MTASNRKLASYIIYFTSASLSLCRLPILSARCRNVQSIGGVTWRIETNPWGINLSVILGFKVSIVDSEST